MLCSHRIAPRSLAALGSIAMLVALLSTRSASAQSGYDSPPPSSDESGVHGTQGRVTDPYEGAMRLMSQGNYTDALKVLKAIANQVPDSEVALLQIGHCYIKMAKSATTAEAAQRNIDIGTGWILEAATVGLRDAQEELVQLYLDGKFFFSDPAEAGKWYLIWKDNRSDVAFGIGEFNRTLEKRLKLALNEDDWREARDRVKEWEPGVYTPPMLSGKGRR